MKTERRITYPEAKKIVNMYSVPKPHLPSYASTLKAPSKKEMSTQAGESQILSLTSVNITNTCKSSSMTEKCNTSSRQASVGASGVAAPKPAASTLTKSVAANLPTRVERNPRSPNKGNQKLKSDRMPKGANDPVALHNKFGTLEDMDFRSHSPKKTKREAISHKTH